MKPASPSQRLTISTSSADVAPAAAERLRKTRTSAPIDRPDTPQRARRSPSPTKAAPRAPSSPKVHTIDRAQEEIAKALAQGYFKRVQAVMQQAADGRRLGATLRAPDDGEAGPYAALVDQCLGHLDNDDAKRLVSKFGVELMNATLEHNDAPLFERCCRDLHTMLPELASRDSAWLARAAAKDPQALSVLLSHLPTKHWPELLTANKGEAMALLWRNAVREHAPGAAHPDRRKIAFGTLTQIFTHVPVQVVTTLHYGILVQRHLGPALRKYPAQMRTLERVLTQRGGTVPWGDA